MAELLQALVLAAGLAVAGMGIAVYSRIGMIQNQRAGQSQTVNTRWYFAGLAAAFLLAPAAFVILLVVH